MKKTFIVAISLLLLLCLRIPAIAENTGAVAPSVTFHGNPTTGYEWLFQTEDESVVSVVEQDFISDSTDANMVGAGGTFVFRLEGAKAGRTSISFRYARAWEHEANPPTITYQVSVDDALNVTILGSALDLGL